GLLAHAAGQARRIVVLPTGRIDDGEIQPEKVRFAESAIPRDARLIVHQRQFLADQTIEQRGLADIRSADNDNLWEHNPAELAVYKDFGKLNGKFLPPRLPDLAALH